MWEVLAQIATIGTVMTINTRTEQDGCPVARTAEIIGNKWTPLIVRDLAHGQKRFSELERSLRGISPKTLSERLKRLEESEVVDRHCFAEVPPRVEYTLTPKGYALLPVIDSMRAFGREWLADEECEPEATEISAHSAAL
jgi:DNA-binding HxlR family transcriptional regulator